MIEPDEYVIIADAFRQARDIVDGVYEEDRRTIQQSGVLVALQCVIRALQRQASEQGQDDPIQYFDVGI